MVRKNEDFFFFLIKKKSKKESSEEERYICQTRTGRSLLTVLYMMHQSVKGCMDKENSKGTKTD